MKSASRAIADDGEMVYCDGVDVVEDTRTGIVGIDIRMPVNYLMYFQDKRWLWYTYILNVRLVSVAYSSHMHVVRTHIGDSANPRTSVALVNLVFSYCDNQLLKSTLKLKFLDKGFTSHSHSKIN